MSNNSEIPFIKKHRIAIFAVLAFVVALGCIFTFVGSSADGSSEASECSDISSQAFLEGYGVYFDAYLVAAVSAESDADVIINSALEACVASVSVNENAVNSFSNEIVVKEGSYPAEAFIGNERFIDQLGEKVIDYSGKLLPVTLSVKSVVTYSENVVLEHETKTVYTDSLLNGSQKVVTEGFNGEAVETREVIYVNGVETATNVVSLDVTTAAVDEVVRVGTRSDGMVTASVGNFIKPYDGIISSYMGPRWGTTHNGIDICQYGGCFRDPAMASADGVVVSADDSLNGYGNCVIIDHGNGIKTLYAHLDSISVVAGEIVDAGDVIGLIGSTGNSTGPHLHFEVRINDEPVNPLMFVDYE